MVYFLGRDVSVLITTESNIDGEKVGISGNKCVAGATDVNAGTQFANDMSVALFSTHVTAGGTVQDLTGVDISVGATDEDITFIGQKGAGKVEIKKEMTVSLTRKKNDNLWDIVFNGPTNNTYLKNFSSDQSFGARWGLGGVATGTIVGGGVGDGLTNPKSILNPDNNPTLVEYGYRINVRLKSGSDIISIPNCTINSYSTSLNADGVTEETMEFGTQQSILPSADGLSIDNTPTAQTAY